DEPGDAAAEPRLDRVALRALRLAQATRLRVLDQLGDRVGGVLLVRADHARRAALDPADDVLAGDRLAVLGRHAPAVVADQAAALVERHARQRPAAVADRAQHEAALDHLLLARRDRLEVAVLVGFDPVAHYAQAADRLAVRAE